MFRAVNSAGGINGCPIALPQLVDDAYDAVRTAENVKKGDDGAVVISMLTGTTSLVGALKAANELKMPLVVPYTGAGPVVKFSE